MIPAKVKNWSTFQHYRHRAPPWIKLHRKLLDDFTYVRLGTCAKALAPLLWLVAAEKPDGEFDADPEYLAFRCRMPIEDVAEGLGQLVNQGFIVVSPGHASALLAACTQHGRKAPEPAPPTPVLALPAPSSSFDPVQLANQLLASAPEGFASALLAACLQRATTERETETETETEKSNTPLLRSSSSPASLENADGASGADRQAAGDEVAITLPAKGGESVKFTRQEVMDWAECYPLVDVDAELRAILGWLRSNPGKRKVGLKGTRRMIGTWLLKAQREASDAKRNGKPSPAPSAVGRTFDDDEHTSQGSAFWLDPPSTENTDP